MVTTLVGKVCARLDAGVLWVLADMSCLSEVMAEEMAWIHVFISSWVEEETEMRLGKEGCCEVPWPQLHERPRPLLAGRLGGVHMTRGEQTHFWVLYLNVLCFLSR
jgi:hypothetical protein